MFDKLKLEFVPAAGSRLVIKLSPPPPPHADKQASLAGNTTFNAAGGEAAGIQSKGEPASLEDGIQSKGELASLDSCAEASRRLTFVDDLPPLSPLSSVIDSAGGKADGISPESEPASLNDVVVKEDDVKTEPKPAVNTAKPDGDVDEIYLSLPPSHLAAEAFGIKSTAAEEFAAKSAAAEEDAESATEEAAAKSATEEESEEAATEESAAEEAVVAEESAKESADKAAAEEAATAAEEAAAKEAAAKSAAEESAAAEAVAEEAPVAKEAVAEEAAKEVEKPAKTVSNTPDPAVDTACHPGLPTPKAVGKSGPASARSGSGPAYVVGVEAEVRRLGEGVVYQATPADGKKSPSPGAPTSGGIAPVAPKPLGAGADAGQADAASREYYLAVCDKAMAAILLTKIQRAKLDAERSGCGCKCRRKAMRCRNNPKFGKAKGRRKSGKAKGRRKSGKAKGRGRGSHRRPKPRGGPQTPPCKLQQRQMALQGDIAALYQSLSALPVPPSPAPTEPRVGS
ncbi:hypothetical protein EMIHUDRAFT_469682 [Emiliania huxleyi CCMP1516]|uniref:Uncharacterized protein n=2 Tax=Emiliania huxleyi TaxID=2903 RepID=A0A0D3JEW0_EMIH1|nr:hypothetical protein EMIHUDRAFT_469682 [Emiliania huxleyi CCMP1516]EOD22045.1 hypothetical protein EMIHUDRAFT_469682 [Emiliania huxleyi CCMP1516]|eukprot:XP_005774474.1 hypothetical protein EMIHUDRAFT_469682 [Emiliania huxleyi CCMP1516]